MGRPVPRYLSHPGWLSALAVRWVRAGSGMGMGFARSISIPYCQEFDQSNDMNRRRCASARRMRCQSSLLEFVMGAGAFAKHSSPRFFLPAGH